MKQKIYVKLFDGAEKLTIKEQGDWIDLKVNEDVKVGYPYANMLKRNRKEGENSTRKLEFSLHLIPLGVGMMLPAGMEAHVVPRSSTFKKWHILLANSYGIIDNSYCGEEDEWKFPAIAFDNVDIPRGTAIAQFRIVPSQRATFWQKLKWLFSSGVEIVYVPTLRSESRGGFGSTGDK